jgi:hypothetical protein
MSKTVQVVLPDELYERLVAEANGRGIKLSTLVREYLDGRELKRGRPSTLDAPKPSGMILRAPEWQVKKAEELEETGGIVMDRSCSQLGRSYD